MSLRPVTPFERISRRSVPIGTDPTLSGRWMTLNSSGVLALPGSADPRACYLLWEGLYNHIGSNTQFAGTAPYMSTDYDTLPAVEASGQAALAYGKYIYEVGPEGCDPTQVFTVGMLVTIDANGRLIPVSGSAQPVGVVEIVSTDGSSLVTLLRIRALN